MDVEVNAVAEEICKAYSEQNLKTVSIETILDYYIANDMDYDIVYIEWSFVLLTENGYLRKTTEDEYEYVVLKHCGEPNGD